MADPIKISTGKYIRQGKVDIDGRIWSVILPGAGTEMRFSQASRACKLYGARIDLLEKKIDAGSATLAELDQYEEYSKKYDENEKAIYDIFKNVFKDDTKDNSEVLKWLEETPTAIIVMAFEDVKAQADKAGDDGRTEQTSSAG